MDKALSLLLMNKAMLLLFSSMSSITLSFANLLSSVIIAQYSRRFHQSRSKACQLAFVDVIDNAKIATSPSKGCYMIKQRRSPSNSYNDVLVQYSIFSPHFDLLPGVIPNVKSFGKAPEIVLLKLINSLHTIDKERFPASVSSSYSIHLTR